MRGISSRLSFWWRTFRRKVWVEVEETDERLKDERAGKSYSPFVFKDQACDAALEKAPMLAGWEQVGVDYSAKAEPSTKPHKRGRDRLINKKLNE